MKRLLFILFSILVVSWTLAAESYPFIFGSFREIPGIHKTIDRLRKQRDGGFTDTKHVYSVMEAWAENCPADTYLIIEQPGLQVRDFQQLVTRYEGVSLWGELRKFLSRCGTVGSFPRLDSPFNIERFERFIVDHCDAKRLRADPQAAEPIAEYIDSAPRVIKLKFDPLPESEYERAIALQANDAKIIETLRNTPSPFFSIIYTSRTGEPFGTGQEFKTEKHLDIFADIVRLKRDPRNRRAFQQHEPRQPKIPTEDDIQRLPPRAVYEREKQERLEKEKKDDRHVFNSDEILDKDTVLVLVILSVAIFIIYQVLLGTYRFVFRGAEAGGKAIKIKEDGTAQVDAGEDHKDQKDQNGNSSPSGTTRQTRRRPVPKPWN